MPPVDGPSFLAACTCGDLEAAQHIKEVSQKARDWHVTAHADERGRKGVHLACANGHTEMVAWLATKGGGHPHLPQPDDEGVTPAQHARNNGHDALAEWVGEFIAVDALQFACRRGDIEKMAEAFTPARAAQRSSVGGWQAIHFACDGMGQGGKLATVQWLHKRGVLDLTAQTSVGWSPMIFACRHGVLELAQWLREQGVVVDAGGTYEKGNVHPLDRACAMGHLHVAAWLHGECGVPLDVTSDETGETPAHAACFGGHVGMVEWLHAHGASLHVRSKKGSTPFDQAKKFKRTALVRWIKTNAPPPRRRDPKATWKLLGWLVRQKAGTITV